MNLTSGQKLSGRYRIISQLGQGGFGQTFLAEDQHLPGHQTCVVKQFKPQVNDPANLQTARRLFDTEAQMLYQLGTHNQIPQLFAYFEEKQEFYLVQEYIEGNSLAEEINSKKSEKEVIIILQEILEILAFVHQQKVIHRDVNPQNILRRKEDGKLVLIDFGAVKQITTQVVQARPMSYTVAIGTPGYLPSEQAIGHPKLSSDIYAVGMIGIQALTGCFPEQLPTDSQTGEISWHDLVTVSLGLTYLLDTMVRYDFRQRYPSATEALEALNKLTTNSDGSTVVVLETQANSNNSSLKKEQKYKSWLVKGLIGSGFFGIGTALFIVVNQFINLNNAVNLYEQGKTFYDLKKYEQALEYYQKSLQIRPDYQKPWQGQGDTLQALKRHKEALDAYEKAIQLQPDNWQSWLGRAQVLEKLGRYQEAIDAFKNVIQLKDNSWEAWQGLGNIQMKLQQYSEAVNSLEKSLRFNSNEPSIWYQKGWALQNIREYEEAIESYDKAVELKPDFSQAWYQRGNIFMNLQKYQDAVDSYAQVVQFQPNFSQAWYSKGIALNHLRRYEEAIVAYEQATKAKFNYYEAWYQKGWVLHQLKRYGEAVVAYEQAIKLKPRNYQAWYNKGNAFYNLANYQQAVNSYQQAITIKPDYYQVWNSLGNALLNLKQYQEAIAAYDQALRYKSDYREAKTGKEQAQHLFDQLSPVLEPETKDKDLEINQG